MTWWLYPKYVRIQLTVCIPLFLYCSFTNSVPETKHIFASDLVALECCPLSNLLSSESCQAHMHGFGPFSFYFLYFVFDYMICMISLYISTIFLVSKNNWFFIPLFLFFWTVGGLKYHLK